MLILRDKKNLKEQEVWLYDAYKKILSKIVKIASSSSIDPFASEYIGKNSANTVITKSLMNLLVIMNQNVIVFAGRLNKFNNKIFHT